jgi:hypothetical protein
VPLLVEILPDLLLPGQDIQLHEVYGTVRGYLPDQCDDTIGCRCGGRVSGQPEWKHQVRWAIRDLVRKKVLFRTDTEKYRLADGEGSEAALILACTSCEAAYRLSSDPNAHFCIACGSALTICRVLCTRGQLETLGALTL